MSPGWTQDLYTLGHATISDYQPSHRRQPISETTHQYGSYIPSEDARNQRQSSSQSPVQGQHQGQRTPYQHYSEAIIGRPIAVKHQPLYLPERNNPGVATMNINATAEQPTYMPANRLLPQYSQSLQRTGSPSSYSSASVPTPPPQEMYYHPSAQKSAFHPQYQPGQGQQFSDVPYQPSQFQPMMQTQPPMRLVPVTEGDMGGHSNGISTIQQQAPYQQHFQQEQIYPETGTPYQQGVQVIGASYPPVNNYQQVETFDGSHAGGGAYQ